MDGPHQALIIIGDMQLCLGPLSFFLFKDTLSYSAALAGLELAM